MSIYVNNGSWRNITEFYVKHNDQWRTVVEAYVKDGGEWRRFWPLSAFYSYSIFSVPTSGGYTTSNNYTTSGSASGIGFEVTLLTAASAGFKFDSISANNSATVDGLVVTIQASGTTSISAIYTLQSYQLYVYSAGPGVGYTDPASSGNPYTYNYTDLISLSAGAESGSTFTTWILDGTTAANLTANPLVIPMPFNNLSVSAYFDALASEIFTFVVPAGVGTLTIYPAADAPNGKWYSTTEITAVATVTNPYYDFQEIIIDATTGLPNSATVVVGAGHSISALFVALATATITTGVSAVDNGGPTPESPGSVAITPAAPTSNIYLTSTEVTATATPAAYYGFAYYIVDASEIYTNPYAIQVENGHTITALFSAWPVLTTSVSGTGGGSVSPAGSVYVDPTSTISVQATPDACYGFAYFEVDGSSLVYTNPYVDGIGGGHTVVAAFTAWPVLTTAVSGTGGGTIDPAPGSVCVDPASTISVQATPNACYGFAYFDVDGTPVYDNPYIDGIGSGHTVTAAFTAWPVLTTAVSGTGGGTIDPAPGSVCVDPASTISVQATPGVGYDFAYFDVDGSPVYTNPYVDGIGGGHTVTAAFSAEPVTTTTTTTTPAPTTTTTTTTPAPTTTTTTTTPAPTTTTTTTPAPTLTVSYTTGGTASPTQQIPVGGTSTNITAVEGAGYNFSSWTWSPNTYDTGNGFSNTTNPTRIIMVAGNQTITANFVPEPTTTTTSTTPPPPPPTTTTSTTPPP